MKILSAYVGAYGGITMVVAEGPENEIRTVVQIEPQENVQK